MSDLDRIFRELSEAAMQLGDLSADAYDDRARLESKREALHAEAVALRVGSGPLPRMVASLQCWSTRHPRVAHQSGHCEPIRHP